MEPPLFATTNSPLLVSRTTPHGLLSPVTLPPMVLIGPALPFAVRAYTVIEKPARFATINSLFRTSTATPRGPSSIVPAPVMVRRGATLPLAVRGYTVTEYG